MKRSRLQKIASLLLAAVVAFGTFATCTTSTFAASKWVVDVTSPMYVDCYGGVYVFNSSTYKDAKILKVTSSNSKVVKVNKEKFDDGTVQFSLLGKKKGKAKIKVTYKTTKGHKVTKTKTVKVKPYPDMIKSLKINGTSITTSAKKNAYMYHKEGFKKTKVDIKVVPADGWVIDYVYGYSYKYDPWKSNELKLTKSMVKGKKSITFSSKLDELDIHVNLKKKSDDSSVDYNIDLMR